MKTRILPKRWAAKVATAFVALVVVAAAGTLFAYSAVAAVACPACYRFERLAPEVFVDRAMPTEDRNRVMDILFEARERVGAFYGGFTSNPRILICSTERCYRDIGGHRERGRSFFDFALMLSPRGLNVTIASHELSHVELHHRLGLLRSINNSIPSWFNEGVAVVVSDDRRYLAPAEASDRCLVRSDGPLPGTMAEWDKAAGQSDSHIYAEAACRVSTWMSSRGGSSAVTTLVKMVSTGMSFSRAYL
jgi:hypothetical protein